MTYRLPKHQVPVSLRRLFPGASFVGCADVRVVQATERSTECTADSLFAAIPGTRVDGTHFALDAIRHGANSVLVESPLPEVTVPQCIVPNARQSYALLCSELAGRPSEHLNISAVTGTNGKTTVTWLIRSILEAANNQVGLLGTIEYSNGIKSERATLTTPDSKQISSSLRDMVLNGATHAAIELSSHALDQDRTAGTLIDAAIVTNVTQDHFDYHNDFASYLQSKSRILEHLKPNGAVIINADDEGSRTIGQNVPDGARLLTYGIDSAADVTARIIEQTTKQTRFELCCGGAQVEVRTRLIGQHNVSNCLAAAATAIAAGTSIDAIVSGIERLDAVPGRLERVDVGQSFDVFVDYAHTDDALARCLDAVSQIAWRRVVCVFGAGGDRDKTKRPLLGRAASRADLAIVTSDNPRSENPSAIIEDIVQGFPGEVEPLIEPDRAKAIQLAVELAEPGDCVVIAGKGHETEQIIGSEHMPFDDRQTVRQALLDSFRQQVEDRVKIRA